MSCGFATGRAPGMSPTPSPAGRAVAVGGAAAAAALVPLGPVSLAAAVGAGIGGSAAASLVLPDRLVERALVRRSVRRPRAVMAAVAGVVCLIDVLVSGRDVSSHEAGRASDLAPASRP